MMNRQRIQSADEKARALQTSRTIFVANIPYDVTEEQLVGLFSEVGPVQEFVLKFDATTGRPKGFGFCHYFDHETALSAVRNLKDVHISGRSLRVELSTDEPGPKKAGPPGAAGGGPVVPPGPPGRLPGGPGGFAGASAPGPVQGQFGAPPGPPGGGFGFGRGGPGGAPGLPPPTLPPSGPGPGPVTAAPGVNMNMLPPGQDLPMGERATDVISKTLASIPPGKLEEVLMGMKTMVKENPEGAKAVFLQHPQLAYALFQAMLLMNAVDPNVLQRMKPVPPPQAAAPAQPPFIPPPQPFQPAPTPSGNYGAGYGNTQSPYSNPGPSIPGPGPRPPLPMQSYGAPPPQQQQPPQHPQQQGPPQGYPGPGPNNQHNMYGRPGPPPPHGAGTPLGGGGYGGPMGTNSPYGAAGPTPVAPPPAATPPMNPAVTQALSMVSEDQRAMLLQVLSLTSEQINALPADQKAGVMQLRSQFGM